MRKFLTGIFFLYALPVFSQELRRDERGERTGPEAGPAVRSVRLVCLIAAWSGSALADGGVDAGSVERVTGTCTERWPEGKPRPNVTPTPVRQEASLALFHGNVGYRQHVASQAMDWALGAAKPSPSLPPPCERMSVLMPTTLRRASTSGPPLLPGLMGASVWM